MVDAFAIYFSKNINSTEYETGLLKSGPNVHEQSVSGKSCRVFLSRPDPGAFLSVAARGQEFAVRIGREYDGSQLAQLALDCQSSNELVDQINRCFGQYCLAAYLDDRLHLFTDPGGLRELFYVQLAEGMLVGSNIWIIRQLLDKEIAKVDEIDQQFLLRFGYYPSDKTIYTSVKRLPSRSYFCFRRDGLEKQLQINHEREERASSVTNPVENLHQVLAECTSQQLGNVKSVGVLLGGFDSALVAAMAKQQGCEVQTFSFSYNDRRYNQPLTQELAKFLNIEHHWIDITPATIQSGLERYDQVCNAPVLWPNYVVQTQHVCEHIRAAGCQAIVSGDGCDTLFLGYPSTYWRGGIYRRMPRLPRYLSLLIGETLNALGAEYLCGHPFRVSASLLDASTYPTIRRPLRSFQIFNPMSFRRLTLGRRQQSSVLDARLEKMEQQCGTMSYVRKIYFGKSLISPNRTKLISSSDGSGLTIDSPYLHPRLSAFANSLPESVLRPDKSSRLEGKAILMSMAEQKKLLPNNIIYQPKMAAIKSPIDQWIAGPLRPFMNEHLKALPFTKNDRYLQSLIDDLMVERLYKRYLAKDSVVCLAISLLATYASFFKD